MKKTTLLILLTVASLFKTSAQTDTTTLKNGFKWSGNADLFWRFSSNEAESTTHFPTLPHGKVGLGWVNLQSEYQHNRWHAFLDLGVGQRAKAFAGTEDWHSIFQQFTLDYAVSDKLKLTTGYYLFPFNYEYAQPGANLNYTYSILYSMIPVGYFAVKADYQFSDNWSGWLGVFHDPNVRFPKSFQPHPSLGLTYAKDDKSLTFNLLGGKDFDTTRNLAAEVILTYPITEKLMATADFQWSSYKDKGATATSFNSLVGYLTYNFSEKFALTARGERFSDPHALYFGEQNNRISALTISPRFQYKNFILQPEIRFEKASKSIYLASIAKNYTNRETAAMLVLIYKFGTYPQ